MCSSSTPRSCCGWRTSGSRCCGSTPSRSCGSGSAPTVRTSRRCTRSRRRCDHLSGSRVRRCCSRPRRSSRRTTSCTTWASGRHHGKVSDLAYHNTLMVQIWSMLATRDVRLSVRALQELPRVPTTTAWICYLRCHDDIGWAIDDDDAAAVGSSGSAHRAFLSDFYTGEFPDSFARGLVFQANPATGDRRVSGMTQLAHRCGARPRPGRPECSRSRASGAFCWRTPSSSAGAASRCSGWATRSACRPTLHGPAVPGHESDNRWSHRPPMDAQRQAERDDPETVAGSSSRGCGISPRSGPGYHCCMPPPRPKC